MPADFQQLKRWVMDDWKAQGEFREKAREEFIFEAGGQWSEDERLYLENSARVPIVFNRVQPIIASVAGLEINNRTEVQFIPREIGDIKPNEILTEAARWFRDTAHAAEVESEAFRDLLVCGIGWTDTSLDFEMDEEGEPTVERIDPLEMGYDARARKRSLTDSSRFFRVHTMSREEAMEQWPDVDPSMLDAKWLGGEGTDSTLKTTNYSGDEYAYNDSTEQEDRLLKAETVRIVQIQWRERETLIEYVDPMTGQTEQLPEKAFRKAEKAFVNAGVPIESRQFTRRTWHQAYLGGEVLRRNQPCPERSTFCAMTGHWDMGDKRFYGLLRIMMDPQRYANTWLSLVMHIIASNAKGGLVIEEGAVSDIRAFEENWSAADSISWVKSGGINKISEKSGPAMPDSLMRMTEMAIHAIRDVSGVNLEIMGMREAQQAGVLEHQRKQSAMTTLARYFDAMRNYRIHQGKVMLHFLREYIAPSGRLVRIMREDQAQYVPLALQTDTMKYDVIVDEVPSSPEQKERTWRMFQDLFPVLMQSNLGMAQWADILEYSPLPSSFIEKLRQNAEAEDNPEPTPEEEMSLQGMEAEIAKLHAEVAKINSETAENEADVIEKQAEAALNQAKANVLGTL